MNHNQGARIRETAHKGTLRSNVQSANPAHPAKHTNVEQRLAALPASQVRHVSMGESRYAGAMMWPVDPLTRLGLWAAGRISVAPVINLCGVCVGTDKVGHFFQQGYEYFRLGQELRARVEGMSLEEKRRFLARLQGSPTPSPFGLETESGSEGGFAGVELTEEGYTELITGAFVMQFGQWLEGFEQHLSQEDIRWIRSRNFIPFYYSEGIYGSASTGVLSRADLQANRMGYWFYRDLWNNPSQTPNICDYVGELWNERREVSSYLPEMGTPRGPISHSVTAESP